MDIEISSHNGIMVESQAIVRRLIEDLPEDLTRDQPLIDRTKRTVDAVYLMVDGKSVFTPVRSGSSDLTSTLVEEGLAEGDLVIIGPYKVLEEIKHDENVRDMTIDPDEEETKNALVSSEDEDPEAARTSSDSQSAGTSSGAMQ